VTTGRWTGDATLEGRRKAVEDDLSNTNLFREVEFTCIGADGLQRLYSQTKNAIAREFVFANRTVAPEIAGVTQAYLGFIPAKEFISIIRDEDGDIIHSIFYDNVRDWLGETEINVEVGNTLTSDAKARFALMNNGVTVIARALQLTGNRFHIEDFQIVNGCQTSHILFNHREHIDDSVMVPIRLIATQDETVVESIIRATNRQTEVKAEQFFAVTEFAKQLETYFQTFPDAHKLFYERRSRQYDRSEIERTRIVTPRNMVRAFASMFLNEPERTTRNYARLLERIGGAIFAKGQRPDPYYVAAFALYKLEYLFRSQRLDTKYKVARYHILLAARLLGNPAPLPRFNARDIEGYCRVLMTCLWDHQRADDLLAQAAAAVDAVAGAELKSDNIRTQPFTERLERHCAGEKANGA
jgi:AIPR protein